MAIFSFEIIAASKRCRIEIASRPKPKCSCTPRISLIVLQPLSAQAR
jgi:hypothetical protein